MIPILGWFNRGGDERFFESVENARELARKVIKPRHRQR